MRRGLGVIAATAVVAGALLPLGGGVAQARPLPDSYMQVLLRVGMNGAINSYEKTELRQRGLDQTAIGQVVTQTKDGGRLTRPEADKIIDAFVIRAKRNAPDPMIAICKQSPKYPACQNR
jgi:hypothetical protein